MKRLAKIFGHDLKNGDFKLFDKNGKLIHFEDITGYCVKREYDKDGNVIYFEKLNGYWSKSEYNKNGKIIYFEDSTGYWSKREYDEDDKEIYFDDRSKTIDKEIVIDGKKYKLVEK